MSSNDEIKEYIDKIMEIEKKSLQKKFSTNSGSNERFFTSKADAEVVNNILTLLGEGKSKKGASK